MTLLVSNEYGRLREAIVHRPGRELVRMSPSARDYFLFDDLLYDHHARNEHEWFTDLLANHLGVELHFFDDLLAEALATGIDAERKALVQQVCALEGKMPAVEQRVGQLEVMVRWFQGQGWPQYTQDPEGDPNAAAPGALPGTLTSMLHEARAAGGQAAKERAQAIDYLQERLLAWLEEGNFAALARDLIEGIESGVAGTSPSATPGPTVDADRDGRPGISTDADALRRFVEGQLFYLTPLPNLMFIRDVGTVVHDRFLLARMAAPGRTREPLLIDFVQRNHPRFEGTSRWTWADASINDPAWLVTASPALHLEGGDVMQLRDDLIVTGVNQRTSIDSVQRLADAWREEAMRRGKKMVLYVLRLPAGFSHLDSVFGMINTDEVVVYAPVFEPYGPASADVVRVELGDGPVHPTRSADFFQSLRRDGLTLTPIPLGGWDPADQQREQWFSAANMLPVAPGKVIIYRSCERTIDELANRGYVVADINDVRSGRVRLSLDDPGKWAVKMKGSELSRGHGGPNSLVLPLVRD